MPSMSFATSRSLTQGAYCRFDPGAARQLAELLRAVAVYAAGGMTALRLGAMPARSSC